MIKIENEKYLTVIEDGVITGFFEKSDLNKNLAGNLKLFGSANFTYNKDDITDENMRPDFKPYKERVSKASVIESTDKTVKLYDDKNDINITYKMTDALEIEASSDNAQISQFGINVELNFLGKLGTNFVNQIMPTSPYISSDKNYTYCIMTRLSGGFLVCAALDKCDGWKIDYSSEYYGHYIENFSFLSSFDKHYKGSGKKSLKVYIKTADTLDEVYEILHSIYNVPYCTCLAGGNFSGAPVVKASLDTEWLTVSAPDGSEVKIDTKEEKVCRIPVDEYGFYTVVPYTGDRKGMDACVWYCNDMKDLFDLSCEAIKKPYHVDDNLCEGGCFLWAMLLDMRLNKHLKFDAVAKEELGIIMGKNGANVPRKTILPYKTEKYAAYHISDSKRIQEQFFGVSILLEAYKLYKESEYLEHAVKALEELADNWITDEGMIFNGEDYTTVCAPVIPIADMANLLESIGDKRAERFKYLSIKIAEFLLKRGLKFPTEGTGEDTESDAEDGSVSCTALSLLYVCARVHYDKRYVDFAKEVLKLHEAWTIYSSDVKMNGSSFRWWETIWEGDGEGPAICAGHAWTIWKAEALYWYSVLADDEEAILLSWNGYMSNFAKTTKEGEMYSCYEADFIRGGGILETKENLFQLKGEDLSVKYVLAHSYPKHTDSSLSRYAWARCAYTWYDTAAVIERSGSVFALNAKEEADGFSLKENIKNVFVGKLSGDITIKTVNNIKLISSADIKIISGIKKDGMIIPDGGVIRLLVKK